MNHLTFAQDILIRETQGRLFGKVTFNFENGKVTSAKIEKTEKPLIDKKDS